MDKKDNSLKYTPFVSSGFNDLILSFGRNYIPNFINSKHLTFLTLIWAILIVFFHGDYPYIIPLCITLWVITDTLDDYIGRFRNEGFIKWGYFTDHSLDYIIFMSIIHSIYNLTNNNNFIIVCGYLGIFNMMTSHLSLNEKDGIIITTCPIKNICIGVADIFLSLSLLLLFTINPKTKKIDLNNKFIEYFTYLFILVTIYRFMMIQHNLSNIDMEIKKLKSIANGTIKSNTTY